MDGHGDEASVTVWKNQLFNSRNLILFSLFLSRLVAKDKANSMNERIGYPEYITNTTRLEEEYKNVSLKLYSDWIGTNLLDHAS